MSTKKIQILGEINKKQVIAQDTAPDDINALWIDTSDNTGDVSVVVYDTAQDLTDEQKAQARENIGASSMSDVQAHIENTDIHVTTDEKAAWNAKLDSYTETDPTVPEWAKQSSKPSYTADEVGAVSYDAVQTLTDEQKAQARDNIELSDSALLTNVAVSLPVSVNWQSVTYGNGRFVAIAYSSSIAAYSDDGITWTQTTLPITASWQSVTYGNGKFIAVSYDSSIAAYSDDGITWTQTTLPITAKWQPVTYGNGRFVAIAYDSSIAAYSDDGITWTQTTLPVSAGWQSVTYGNGRFVAIAYGSPVVVYSDDGISWAYTTLPTSANCYSVTYGNGRFVAITSISSIAVYSDDGINWTETTLPVSAGWRSVTYGNGRFVAIVNHSSITAYSDDGISWTQTTLPTSAKWRSVTYGNGCFVVVSYGDTNVAYSKDGINWYNTTDRLQNTSGEDIASEVKNALNIIPSDIGAQKKLTGIEGQIVGFDADGNAITKDMPTASEIGAKPSSWMPSQTDVQVSAATDYTTNRVRGIALYQDTAPDAIPNGCIVGVYTIE